MQKINNLKIKKGEVVILRADFNVPIKSGKVVDTFRIQKTLKTIDFLNKKGAKLLILAHLGEDGKETLRPIYNLLKKTHKIEFVVDMDFAAITKELTKMKHGEIILLENVRRWPGEKKNDIKLAKDFASLADHYVNDAFSVSHRAHMSIVGLPKYLPSYAGYQLIDEINNLEKALKPKQPLLFILGGFKFGTKLPVLKKFGKISKNYFVGGALANNFIMAEGYEVGKSVIDNDYKITKNQLNDKKLIPIVDVVIDRGGKSKICALNDIQKSDIISDIGPGTVDLLKIYIDEAKTILWNGPMGWYEKGYTKATIELLKLLAKRKGKALTIIGGGDTANLVHKQKMEKDFSFVSTGGGATLEYLSKGTLPGIKALK